MNPSIAVLAGDGIGPEVMAQTLRVLQQVAPQITTKHGLIGGAAYCQYKSHFPTATKQLIDVCDAVLFGSVGGPIEAAEQPQWKNCEVNSILALRNHLKLAINSRPAKFYPALKDISPLKNERLEACDEILILRELLGDVYFGEKRTYTANGYKIAEDTAKYDENQIAQVAHHAFKIAATRKQQVVSVDKANVLDTSKLWRQVFQQVAKQYPEITLTHMLVDNCAMQLILNPAQFDVIATSNLFGDILSDAASALPGSLGMMPSASFSSKGFGLYEPSGGSAPDIAGQNKANPMAQILSLAMMLRHSFDLHTEANAIEKAIENTLDAGFRTQDIMQVGRRAVGTQAFTDEILHHL
ncbi:3-isopropylmalate dehydrogenase [Marinicella litoralis]